MPFCVLCQQPVNAWRAHPAPQARREFAQLLGAVGSDAAHYGCPHCQSNDLDRHVWLYLTASDFESRSGALRVLHIAPNLQLSQRIAACQLAEYRVVDVTDAAHIAPAAHTDVDLAALPFESESFDLIICNQQLNRVPELAPVLDQLARCLKTGGQLLAQVWYAPHVKHTLELNGPVSAAEAEILFGAPDNRRLFGADLSTWFARAGLTGEPRAHNVVLPNHDALEFGCNAQEPLFLFAKKPCPASPS